MALISKKSITAPALPEQVVPVPELGGDVLVRGLDLGKRMALAHQFKNKEAARVNFGHLAPLLALTVLDADDEPVFTEKQWSAWGAQHLEAALNLWDIAWRLSDLDGKEAKKNAKAPTSA